MYVCSSPEGNNGILLKYYTEVVLQVESGSICHLSF